MARVLIVDDETSIRLTLKVFLSKGGHEVDMAADVEADDAKGIVRRMREFYRPRRGHAARPRQRVADQGSPYEPGVECR